MTWNKRWVVTAGLWALFSGLAGAQELEPGEYALTGYRTNGTPAQATLVVTRSGRGELRFERRASSHVPLHLSSRQVVRRGRLILVTYRRASSGKRGLVSAVGSPGGESEPGGEVWPACYVLSPMRGVLQEALGNARSQVARFQEINQDEDQELEAFRMEHWSTQREAWWTSTVSLGRLPGIGDPGDLSQLPPPVLSSRPAGQVRELLVGHVRPLYQDYFAEKDSFGQSDRIMCSDYSRYLRSRLKRGKRTQMSKINPKADRVAAGHVMVRLRIEGQLYVVDLTADQFFPQRIGPLLLTGPDYQAFAEALGYSLYLPRHD